VQLLPKRQQQKTKKQISSFAKVRFQGVFLFRIIAGQS